MEFALRGKDRAHISHYTVQLKTVNYQDANVILPLTNKGIYYALGTMPGDAQTLPILYKSTKNKVLQKFMKEHAYIISK